MAEISGLEAITFDSAVSYTILEEIGRGGMGIVYLAERSCMGVKDLVVLKSIRSLSIREEELLREEANIATQLRHENIVKTYGLEALPFSVLPVEILAAIDNPVLGLHDDADRSRKPAERRAGARRRGRTRVSSASLLGSDEEKKLLLIVMDYVEGISLHWLISDHIKRGYLVPAPLGAFIIGQMCRALAYAHTRIIHRDISPDNILINLHGVCKLTDFGIAMTERQSVSQVAGKSLYMAPEIYTGALITERSDLFSLGLCFYYVLTGIPPLWTDPRLPLEEQLHEVRDQLQAGIPAPDRVRSDIPPEVSRIVMKMIAPLAPDRYGRASLVGDDIEQNYLYARGFGPTSHSLGAYVRFYESGFTECDTDDVSQLTFLRDDEGRMSVHRPLDPADFTDVGRSLIGNRRGSPIHKTMALREKQARRNRFPDRAVRHVLKVKCGLNSIESFAITAGGLTVGSGEGCDCRLVGDGGAEPEQAFLVLEGGAIVVENRAATRTTRVGGKPVDRAEIQETDRLAFGAAQAIYIQELEGPPPARVVRLGGGGEPELPPLDRDIALRFDLPVVGSPLVLRLLDALYLPLEIPGTHRSVLREAVEEVLVELETIAGWTELRVHPVRSRLLVQISTRDPGPLAGLFAGFKGRPLAGSLGAVHRIEYIHYQPMLCLMMALA